MDEAARQPAVDGDSSPAVQSDAAANPIGATVAPEPCSGPCACRSADRTGLTRLQFIRRSAAGAAIGAAALAGCREQPQRAAVDRQAADVAELRKVDPRLVLYKETGRIETSFAEPRGLAINGGGVDVAGDSEVRSFDRRGEHSQTIATGGTPVSVAPATFTRIVAQPDHLEIYDEKGPRIASWPAIPGKPLITSVAAFEDAIWVGDSGNRVVIGYDYKGREIGRIGARDEAAKYPGLILPSPHLQVAISPYGHVIVNNPGMHRIEVHDRSGKMLSFWGQEGNEIEGFCGCCNPTNFAILPDGRFVTSEKGLPRVKIYSARGDFDGVVAGPDAFADSVVDLPLAAGRDGRIYVLDTKAKAVRVFAPKA